jgi:hypothetical protein
MRLVAEQMKLDPRYILQTMSVAFEVAIWISSYEWAIK